MATRSVWPRSSVEGSFLTLELKSGLPLFFTVRRYASAVSLCRGLVWISRSRIAYCRPKSRPLFLVFNSKYCSYIFVLVTMQQVSWNVNEYHTCRLKAAGKNKPVADSNREIEYIHQMARPCSRSRHRCRVDYSAVQMQWPIGNESMAKIIINDTKICFKTAISILLISNDNSFRVLFDKIASVYFIWKIYLYF